MIKKIKKIKNLGIFSDYKWDTSSMLDFQKYNLFYGWNGSGKTTLTKLFSILGSGESLEFSELEYEVETETGDYKNGQTFDKKVMVFNQDYIEENIEIYGSKAKPIFILGAENKAIAEKIAADELLLNELKKIKKGQEELKDKKEVEKGKKFTDVAKIIGANTSGSSLRNYRKPDAEKTFISLSEKEFLTKEDVNKNLLILKQEEKAKIQEINLPNNFEDLEKIIETSKGLCLKKVSSSVIERLKENPDISKWVESGLTIHQEHDSKICEFCNQSLSEHRINELVGHFNKEDQELKNAINEEIEKINHLSSSLNSLIITDKANLYTELQSDYVSSITTLNKEKINISVKLSELVKVLEDKKNKTTEEVHLEFNLDSKFKDSIASINSVVAEHNSKTANFQTQRNDAQKKLENHYLSEIFDEIKGLETEVNNCVDEIKKLNDGYEANPGITDLISRIAENKAVISSEHKACEMLNQKLETFLGRKEIVFEVAPEGGYIISRDNKIATNLSEGEKTAIAFVYFVVHLNDQNFNINDGIIVIDDPVSSLDSNSLFQAFSFLKNSVEDAKQVFIFTHNFDFLRLLINWLNFFYRNEKNHKKVTPYFMISNIVLESARVAEIKALDPLLINHESEYHYLCKLLLELKDDGCIASVYNIPNIARKVLETFLMFRVPNGDQTFKKLKALEFDEDKKTAIYKFTNDQSHITGKGFDPCLVQETQKNVKNLLDMMEKTSPKHFDILKSSILGDTEQT